MASKRPNDEQDSHDGARKLSKTVESDDDSDEETPTKIYPTEIDDVFETTAPLKPSVAKQTIQDWDEPIVLIISKGARDKFLTIFSNISQMQNTEPSVSGNMRVDIGSNDTSSDELRNKHLAEDVVKDKEDLFQKLNENMRQFTESSLKQDLSSAEEFNTFRNIRKVLTRYYVHSTKVESMIEKMKQGEDDYLIKTETNIVPNNLDAGFINNIKDRVHKTTQALNRDMHDEILNSLHKQTDEIKTAVGTTEPKLLAKAWRVVLRCNKNTQNITFRSRPVFVKKQETYNNVRNKTYSTTSQNENRTEEYRQHRPYRDNRVQHRPHRTRRLDSHADSDIPEDSYHRYEYKQERDYDRHYHNHHDYPQRNVWYNKRIDRTNRDRYQAYYDRNFPPLSERRNDRDMDQYYDDRSTHRQPYYQHRNSLN